MKAQTMFLGAIAAVLAACGGGGGGSVEPPAAPLQPGSLRAAPTLVATLDAAMLNQLIGAYGEQAGVGPAPCDVRVVAIDYHTPGTDGTLSNASGVVLLPGGADPACAGPRPLLGYGRGTEPRRNVTLASPESPETLLLAAVFAARGYAVVASDMLGHARSEHGFHPYLHVGSQGTSVLDSLRAARSVAGDLGVALSGQVLLAGYSQGGHSVASAQRAIEALPGGEFQVVAASYMAAPLDLVAAVRNPEAVQSYEVFATLLLTGYQRVYGDIYANPAEAFRAPYAAIIESLLPADDLAAVIGSGKLPASADPRENMAALMQPAYLEAVQTDASHPLVRAAAQNSFMDWVPGAPALVCHGLEDPMVPPALHSLPYVQGLTERGFSHVGVLDVDPLVRQVFGEDGAVPTHPEAAAAYYARYHLEYLPPLCMLATLGFFQAGAAAP